MAGVELHTVENAVQAITHDLETTSRGGGTWSVLGEPTAGKSAVLEELHDHFVRDGTIRPILVTPPPRAYDSAHAALIDLAEGLDLTSKALADLQDPKASWSSKLKRVRAGLAREGRFVLLLDDPDAWSPNETYFTTFVQDVWSLVFDSIGIPTVTAGPTPFRVRGHHAIHLVVLC